MKKRMIPCEVKDGWLHIDRSDKLDMVEFLSDYEGKKMDMVVSTPESKRSLKANAYYWGVLIPAFQREWTGMNKQHVHEVLGAYFRLYRRPQEEIDCMISMLDKDKEWDKNKEWYVKSSAKFTIRDFYFLCEDLTEYLIDDIGGYLDENEGRELKSTRAMYGNEYEEWLKKKEQGELFNDKK